MADGFIQNFLLHLHGYLMIFVCAAMCYMPMATRLKISAKRLLSIAVPALFVFSIAGAAASANFGVMENAVVIPASVIFFFVYYKTLDADMFECLCIFMYVASLSCYPYHYGLMLDAMTNKAGTYQIFSPWVELVQGGMLLGIAAVFFLVRRKAVELSENLKNLPMRKIVWVIPFLFAVVLITIIPLDYNTLYTGRVFSIYLLSVTFLFLAENTIVYIFYRFSCELVYNERLEQKNQILEFQSSRYESLKNHIEETAGIRHDFRQQLRTVASLMESENYKELRSYLSEYINNVSEAEWNTLCLNGAVDALAGHYLSEAKAKGISTDWRFELPKKLPLPESVFCGMLGNLLENAIDGCETLKNGEKIIRLTARMPTSSMLAVLIENTFDGMTRTDGRGEIVSSKHKEAGMGLRSVRVVVEKYRGQMRVDHDDKIFSVSVLLNF